MTAIHWEAEMLAETVERAIVSEGVALDIARRAAQSVLRSLQAEYGTQSIYIPAAPRPWTPEDLLRALREGRSVRSICRQYKCDRRTVNKIRSSAIEPGNALPEEREP